MDDIKKNTLLIVDDDKSDLKILAQSLQTEYNVRVASNGESAIRIAEKYTPDLIILDIIMPDMDGYQVFSALSKSEKTSQIPVIFITGLNSNNDEKKGLDLGAADYISKPFDEAIAKLRIRHQIRIINQLRTIEYISRMDQLTEIPNRRSFDIRLRLEWGRAIRENLSLCMLLLDVDQFKNYNDSYGHQQGDKALCMVARIIIKSLKRTSDFAARWGGEEFIILLPNSGSSGGMKVGERIRKSIEAEELLCKNGDATKLSVSVGVYAHLPTQNSSIDDFILKADKAMYLAKKAGRNKVCFYE